MEEGVAQSLDLRIPSRLEEVAGVGRAVWEFAVRNGSSRDAADALELAVCEAVNNAIQHAYEGRPGEFVEIAAGFDAGAATVAVRDRGRALTRPLPAKGTLSRPAGPDRVAQRGLGLHIIAEIVDEVRYGSRDGVNELVLRKTLRPPGS